jgi:hypothetical protein
LLLLLPLLLPLALALLHAQAVIGAGLRDLP